MAQRGMNPFIPPERRRTTDFVVRQPKDVPNIPNCNTNNNSNNGSPDNFEPISPRKPVPPPRDHLNKAASDPQTLIHPRPVPPPRGAEMKKEGTNVPSNRPPIQSKPPIAPTRSPNPIPNVQKPILQPPNIPISSESPPTKTLVSTTQNKNIQHDISNVLNKRIMNTIANNPTATSKPSTIERTSSASNLNPRKPNVKLPPVPANLQIQSMVSPSELLEENSLIKCGYVSRFKKSAVGTSWKKCCVELRDGNFSFFEFGQTGKLLERIKIGLTTIEKDTSLQKHNRPFIEITSITTSGNPVSYFISEIDSEVRKPEDNLDAWYDVLVKAKQYYLVKMANEHKKRSSKMTSSFMKDVERGCRQSFVANNLFQSQICDDCKGKLPTWASSSGKNLCFQCHEKEKNLMDKNINPIQSNTGPKVDSKKISLLSKPEKSMTTKNVTWIKSKYFQSKGKKKEETVSNTNNNNNSNSASNILASLSPSVIVSDIREITEKKQLNARWHAILNAPKTTSQNTKQNVRTRAAVPSPHHKDGSDNEEVGKRPKFAFSDDEDEDRGIFGDVDDEDDEDSDQQDKFGAYSFNPLAEAYLDAPIGNKQHEEKIKNDNNNTSTTNTSKLSSSNNSVSLSSSVDEEDESDGDSDHLSDFEGSDDDDENIGDWNERFQTIMDMISSFSLNTSVSDEINANLALIGLAEDFLYSATAYGKIIISEVYLEDKKKTIRPTNIGGVAGGSKYIVHNILFKFALDTEGLYGKNDEGAAKVAAHELRGLQAYANCNLNQICLPLMALVDYRGFRLIAISILPISKSTLIYGSHDGGNSIYAEDESFNSYMKKAGEILNVKPHMAGLDPKNRKLLYSAADIEGHLGYDGRYYLLDFSRAFPCEQVDRSCKGSNLTRLLRPEFCKNYHIPLCSDAYSNFADGSLFNAEVDDATRFLRQSLVPEFALNLPQLISSSEDILNFRLTECVHSHGINIRYLGLIYHHLVLLDHETGKTAMTVILIEMFSRSIKSILHRKLREKMKKLKLPLEEPYRKLVIAYFNLVFGGSQQSQEYWKKLTSLVSTKFLGFDAHSFTQNPKSHFFSLITNIISKDNTKTLTPQWVLISRIVKIMGLKFAKGTENEIQVSASRFLRPTPFNRRDLDQIGEKIKHMDIVSQAEGYILLVTGMNCRATDPSSAISCLTSSIQHFEEVMNSNSTNKSVLTNCAKAIVLLHEELIRNKSIASTDQHMIDRAVKYLQRAIELDPRDPQTFLEYAQLLERLNNYDEAENMYLTALELDSNYIDGLREYALFLENCRQNYPMSEKFLLRSIPNV